MEQPPHAIRLTPNCGGDLDAHRGRPPERGRQRGRRRRRRRRTLERVRRQRRSQLGGGGGIGGGQDRQAHGRRRVGGLDRQTQRRVARAKANARAHVIDDVTRASVRRAAHVGLDAEFDRRLGITHQLDRRVGREGGDGSPDLLIRRRGRRRGRSSNGSSKRRGGRSTDRRRRSERSRRRRRRKRRNGGGGGGGLVGGGGDFGRAHARERLAESHRAGLAAEKHLVDLDFDRLRRLAGTVYGDGAVRRIEGVGSVLIVIVAVATVVVVVVGVSRAACRFAAALLALPLAWRLGLEFTAVLAEVTARAVAIVERIGLAELAELI